MVMPSGFAGESLVRQKLTRPPYQQADVSPPNVWG
jgi:hypothetical protein